MRYLYTILLSCITSFALAQKTVYIPAYLLDITNVDGAQFTYSKTAESPNFILIWGNTVGTSPATYTVDTNLRFNPTVLLDTLEGIYAAYKALGFLDDGFGTNLAHYKIPVIMSNTWGPAGNMGWASGGDADGIIGAFWVHPLAMHGGHVAAHELAHSLQAQCVIDYRTTHTMGTVWNNAGIFWETHANFMRNLIYPMDVTANGMDVSHLETWGDWKNTYENYELLLAIMEADGIGMVNRLWRESYSEEFPLQTYKRLTGLDQFHFNDAMYKYARRMATYDFAGVGGYLRTYRTQDLTNYLPSVQNTYSILRRVGSLPGHYEIPIEQAPEEYAYNVIPLYPSADSCSVIIKFRGHTETHLHTGWRYGFVAEHPDGTISRYSPIYSDYSAEVGFSLTGDETKMYFVVMGTPYDAMTIDTARDTWHGYPKHYRFPYELNISGAVPEGFQPASAFRNQLKINGHLHPNGGGWVDNAATVASTVFVDSTAMVLGTSTITGNARIENMAMVINAAISGNVLVAGNALVNTGNYTDDVKIIGQSYSENNIMWENAVIDMRARVSNYHLYGNIEVGGDVVVYNDTGSCNNGVYYRLTNYYDNKLLECDGRTATHSVNLDINNTYVPFSDAAMSLHCNCSLLPGCLAGISNLNSEHITVQATPTPANSELSFQLGGNVHVGKVNVTLYNSLGSKAKEVMLDTSSTLSINTSDLPPGMYLAKVDVNGSAIEIIKIIILHTN